MKNFLKVSILGMLAALAATAVYAETLNSVPCTTGLTAECSNPAPDITTLSYNETYGRVLVYTTDGDTWDSGQYAVANSMSVTSFTNVPVSDSAGNVKYVTASFNKWITVSGKNRVTHWTLLSGEFN